MSSAVPVQARTRSHSILQCARSLLEDRPIDSFFSCSASSFAPRNSPHGLFLLLSRNLEYEYGTDRELDRATISPGSGVTLRGNRGQLERKQGEILLDYLIAKKSLSFELIPQRRSSCRSALPSLAPEPRSDMSRICR